MDIISYALLAYGITAIISLMVVGVIVLVNNVMSRYTGSNEGAN